MKISNLKCAGVKLYSGTLTDERTWATQDDPGPALTLCFQVIIMENTQR